jgi:hypothetical protein
LREELFSDILYLNIKPIKVPLREVWPEPTVLTVNEKIKKKLMGILCKHNICIGILN